MSSKIDLVSVSNNEEARLVKLVRKNLLGFISFLLAFLVVFSLFDLKTADASFIKNDQLIDRISKDFTRKFCNSVGFGLSKESAMTFANKENNMIFKKKKGIDSLDKQLIAKKIATSVVETCGYSLDLKGEEDIIDFEKDYLAMNSSIHQGN
tara:strand:+ start:1969 stop:2424 length:456 start_codon:yes stop_codon:yes gene_type:complete